MCSSGHWDCGNKINIFSSISELFTNARNWNYKLPTFELKSWWTDLNWPAFFSFCSLTMKIASTKDRKERLNMRVQWRVSRFGSMLKTQMMLLTAVVYLFIFFNGNEPIAIAQMGVKNDKVYWPNTKIGMFNKVRFTVTLCAARSEQNTVERALNQESNRATHKREQQTKCYQRCYRKYRRYNQALEVVLDI